MEAYIPVNNDFKEELEVMAAMKKVANIKFRADNDALTSIKTQIEGIIKEDEAEFLKTDSGLKIRLDKIVEVDGMWPENYS